MKDRILLVSFSLKICVYCYRSLRHFEIRLYCMNKFREKLQCTYSAQHQHIQHVWYLLWSLCCHPSSKETVWIHCSPA